MLDKYILVYGIYSIYIFSSWSFLSVVGGFLLMERRGLENYFPPPGGNIVYFHGVASIVLCRCGGYIRQREKEGAPWFCIYILNSYVYTHTRTY